MHTVPRRPFAVVLAVLGAALAALAGASAAPAAQRQIIVRYAAGADARARLAARSDAGVVRAASLPLARTEVVAPRTGTSVSGAIADLERSPDVAFAEPDASRRALGIASPNDTRFASQWGLQNTGQMIFGLSQSYLGTPGDDIDVMPAWAAGVTNGSGASVAVVDTGVDLGHPDLAGNLISGQDLVDGDNVPADQNGHGTHVAGVI